MNISYGARTLERLGKEGLIQVPVSLTTFSLDNLPDFYNIFRDQPITVYVGKANQGWMNNSLFKYAYQHKPQKHKLTKKYNLKADEVENFIEQAVNDLGLEKVSRKNISGVAHKSYSEKDVDNFFFVKMEKTGDKYFYLIEMEGKNHTQTGGWGFVPDKKYMFYSDSYLDDAVLRKIRDDMNKIFSKVKNQTGNIIVAEGKITNEKYGQTGPMYIDLYEGYLSHHFLELTPNIEEFKKGHLGHEGLRKEFIEHAFN